MLDRIKFLGNSKRLLDYDELDPDDFQEEGCGAFSINGKIRLFKTREWFFETGDTDAVVEVWQRWVSQNEYLVFNVYRGEERIKRVAVLCSKRGNRVYASRVRERVFPLKRLNLDGGNRSWNKTRLLFITLTYDTKLKSVREAWSSISSEFNSWITGLRKKFGRISYLKVFESTRQGYPHIHLLVLFKDCEFSFFALNGRFRIPRGDRDKIREGWHSYVDVEAVVSPRQAIAYMLKYLLKVHGGEVKGKTPWEISQEGIQKTLALLWVHRKRGYTLSQDFEEALADLMTKPCVTQTVQVDLFGEPIEKWVLAGIYTAQELGILEDPPPYIVELD